MHEICSVARKSEKGGTRGAPRSRYPDAVSDLREDRRRERGSFLAIEGIYHRPQRGAGHVTAVTPELVLRLFVCQGGKRNIVGASDSTDAKLYVPRAHPLPPL